MIRHAYGRGPSQYGELHLPGGDGPHPVVVVIHGGFWKSLYGRKLMRPVCEDLCRRGWAAWNIEYRRLGLRSDGGWPNTFEDVAAAVDALAEIDAPLDLNRVVAAGHSAGGHLALWVAARPGLPDGVPGGDPKVAVTRACAQAGVVNLRQAFHLNLSKGVVRRFLGGTPGDCGDRYALASPADRLPIGIPLLLVHGGLDDVVPASMSEEFAEAAELQGDDVTLSVHADEDHMGHVDPANPMWQEAARWLTA